MVCAVLCGASARGCFSRAMEPPITAPTMPPISAMPTPSSSAGGGDRGGDSGGDKGGGGEIRTSFTGGSICSTVTASADVLRKFEAAVVSASLVVTAVSAASATASFCTLIVNATATLPAVAVASTASKGTTASSSTFWRIEMSTTGVKSETVPEMVTAIFTEYDAGGGAFGGAGGGDAGDGDATVAGELTGEGGSVVVALRVATMMVVAVRAAAVMAGTVAAVMVAAVMVAAVKQSRRMLDRCDCYLQHHKR